MEGWVVFNNVISVLMQVSVGVRVCQLPLEGACKAIHTFTLPEELELGNSEALQ